MDNNYLTEMLNETDRKIKYLQTHYKIFGNNEKDILNENDFKNEIENKNSEEIDKLIEENEKKIKDINSLNILKQLKLLYEKKEKNEENSKRINEINDEIEKLLNLEKIKYYFKMSKSYADEEH